MMQFTAALGLVFLMAACGARSPTPAQPPASTQGGHTEAMAADAPMPISAGEDSPADDAADGDAPADDAAGEDDTADANVAGEGSSATDGDGYSAGVGQQHRPNSPRVAMGTNAASVRGDLDKSTIRRYLLRRIPKMRYCYEKELLEYPELEGALTVDFEITPQGLVEKVEASGLQESVGDCVSETIRTIQFPIPNDGGAVHVTYPFTFTYASHH